MEWEANTALYHDMTETRDSNNQPINKFRQVKDSRCKGVKHYDDLRV
jgi:hypothetical protein